MRFLTEREVKQLLPMTVAIDLVRESFLRLAEGTALNQARRRLTLPGGAQLHSLAGACGDYFGAKVYATHPRPGAGGPGAAFYVLLFRASDGEALAMMEASELGRIRTGAASGVATDCLASGDASIVGMLGTGYQAHTQLHAVCSVRTIREVRVYARRAESRRQFVEAFREFQAGEVRECASPEEAAEGAHIVVTATRSADPVLPDGAVSRNAHINAIGSNVSTHAELDPRTVRRAACIAVDSQEQALMEAGDLLLAYPDARWPGEQVRELGSVLQESGGDSGWRRPDGVTIFESTGLGVQDVAVAGWVYERALATGAGERLGRGV
ncbi:MAG: ornithine cyclodeaminase family protein [Bryobacterales bacterium]|nr:ornithine cyclodeaminase family protein [Bryobacterales bacterium]